MNSKQRGFTIIELMITMGILAIIVGMALPSFTGFVQRNQLSSSVRSIIGGVALTRSQAISQREDVVFEPREGGWVNGWQVNHAGNIIRQSDPFPAGYTFTFANGSTSLTFNSRGILAIATNEEITIADTHGNSRVVHLPRSGSAYIR